MRCRLASLAWGGLTRENTGCVGGMPLQEAGQISKGLLFFGSVQYPKAQV